jgi:hypothetical protein
MKKKSQNNKILEGFSKTLISFWLKVLKGKNFFTILNNLIISLKNN